MNRTIFTQSEIKALTESPDALDAVADHHDFRGGEADAIGFEHAAAFHDQRRKELRAEAQRLRTAYDNGDDHDYPPVVELEWIQDLRQALMKSEMTHNFTLSRDEVMELLGGKYQVWADACAVNPYSSRVCEQGTKSCDVEHTPDMRPWFEGRIYTERLVELVAELAPKNEPDPNLPGDCFNALGFAAEIARAVLTHNPDLEAEIKAPDGSVLISLKSQCTGAFPVSFEMVDDKGNKTVYVPESKGDVPDIQ